MLDGNEAFAGEVWKGLVDLGVPAIAIPEEYGGLGMTPLELCVVAEEIGRAAAPVPFDTSVVLATEALKLAGSEAQKKKWLPLLATGQAIGTLATAEGPQTPRPSNVRTLFGGGRLNGRKVPVADGEAATFAVVLAKNVAGPGRAGAKGRDARRASRRSTRRASIASWCSPTPMPSCWAPRARACACSNGSTMRRRSTLPSPRWAARRPAMYMARDYALERHAFGRAIGSYQAIKHKLADCYVKLELARSNAYYGAMMLTEGGADLPLAAAAARIAATEAYDFASKENIQTHGGIGFTWEADTQFHLRRARVMALSIGGPMAWKDRLVTRLEQKNVA